MDPEDFCAETDNFCQFLYPETDKHFQILDKNLLDPETDVMEQFLGPETDIKHQLLDPETDIQHQFLVDHPKTDIMDQFLDPESDIMGEWTYICQLHNLLIFIAIIYCSIVTSMKRSVKILFMWTPSLSTRNNLCETRLIMMRSQPNCF